MKKLAISISGQTRHYNKTCDEFHDDLHKVFGNHFTYDLYGHTWDNCEHSRPINPKQRALFKSFHMTSNLDIWNAWVKYDIFARTPFRRTWNDSPEWISYIDGSGHGITDFIKQRSIGAWAQIWSFNESLKYIDINQYDGLVRWRWDNGVTKNPHELECAIDTIYDYFRDDKTYTYTGNAECLSMTPQLTTRYTMQDTIMVFNKQGLAKVKRPDFLNTLEVCTYDNNEQKHGPSSHELWRIYLKSCSELIVVAGFPNIRTSLSIGKHIKENKQWDI
tara:strand:- start:175 stop:1002 length:828 start_codon:yes stop_codon:yes gene_type:complete